MCLSTSFFQFTSIAALYSPQREESLWGNLSFSLLSSVTSRQPSLLWPSLSQTNIWRLQLDLELYSGYSAARGGFMDTGFSRVKTTSGILRKGSITIVSKKSPYCIVPAHCRSIRVSETKQSWQLHMTCHCWNYRTSCWLYQPVRKTIIKFNCESSLFQPLVAEGRSQLINI